MFTSICDVKRMLVNTYGSTFVKDIQHVFYSDVDAINKSDENIIFYGTFNDEVVVSLGGNEFSYYNVGNAVLFNNVRPNYQFQYYFTGYKILVDDINKMIPKEEKDYILFAFHDSIGQVMPFTSFVIKDSMSKTDYPLITDTNGTAKFYQTNINPTNSIQVFHQNDLSKPLTFRAPENNSISFGELKQVYDNLSIVNLDFPPLNER